MCVICRGAADTWFADRHVLLSLGKRRRLGVLVGIAGYIYTYAGGVISSCSRLLSCADSRFLVCDVSRHTYHLQEKRFSKYPEQKHKLTYWPTAIRRALLLLLLFCPDLLIEKTWPPWRENRVCSTSSTRSAVTARHRVRVTIPQGRATAANRLTQTISRLAPVDPPSPITARRRALKAPSYWCFVT